MQWLKAEGRARRDKPWVLFTSFIAPHSPLIAPPEYFALYPPASVSLSSQAGALPPLDPGLERLLRV